VRVHFFTRRPQQGSYLWHISGPTSQQSQKKSAQSTIGGHGPPLAMPLHMRTLPESFTESVLCCLSKVEWPTRHIIGHIGDGFLWVK